MNRKLTWKKQATDARDYTFDRLVALKLFATTGLPVAITNRKYCSAVEDQGELGSCTGNAWAGLLQYNECKNGRGGKLYKDLSRLFIYYNERVLEKTITEDSGAELRDGAKAIATYGVCPATDWPYIISKFAVKPPTQAFANALPNAIHSYYSMTTLTELKTCLANGQCFVFGFNCYDYFQSQQMADTGVLLMPTTSETVQGGHAVMAIGYDDTQKRFLIKNSWGKKWGLKGIYDGYFTMPYDYMTNPDLASDFWTVVKDI